MTDTKRERQPAEEPVEVHPDHDQAEDVVAPSDHLLSREEIFAAPDGGGDVDDEPLHGLTVGELAALMPRPPQSSLVSIMANMPKMPATSLFRSPALDFVKMQNKLRGPIFSFPDMPQPTLKVPPYVERPEVGLQRGILEQQKAQNEVLLAMLAENQRSGRQTTWVLRLTAFSAIVAIIAIALSVYFGTRPMTAAAPPPSPNISRSAMP